jgi:hypothetical protein
MGVIMDKGKKSRKKSGCRMSGYIRRHIPEGAVIDFIFQEDFDRDGQMEAVVGYTEFSPFPPESSIIYFKQLDDDYKYTELLSNKSQIIFSDSGIYDNAAVVDLNGDGIPELMLALASGNGHYITLFIFDWIDGTPCLSWNSEECFYHGSAEVSDMDGDGLCGILVESGTQQGQEVIALSEACYHVREGCLFKWNGTDYIKYSSKVRMPYMSYNTAVDFLLGLWKNDYNKTYSMVMMPGFMGLEGLDDSSLNAFKKYVIKNINPVLMRNLSKGKLIPAEPYDSYCLFNGSEDDIIIELVKDKGAIKVQTFNAYTKNHI